MPTCTEQGYTMYTCSCGDSYKSDYTNEKGHSFTNYVSNNDATYSKDGTETATCNRNGCNAKDTRTDEGSMLHTHSYSTKVIQPTCATQGYTTYACACGDRYVGNYTSALGHSFTNYVSNSDGTETAVCDNNGCNEIDEKTDYIFEANDSGYSITGYTGAASDIILPTLYKGKSVNAISAKAFYRNDIIESVTIGANILTIGEYAFYDCPYLIKVFIESGVQSIGKSAFGWCDRLDGIHIPLSVTTIGRDAFYACSDLTIYTPYTHRPSGWHQDWNSSNRMVYWG